jgi:hypothetical protein
LALEVIPSTDTRIFVKIKHPIGFKRKLGILRHLT